MTSKKGENDKKLAEILNDIDDESIEGSIEELRKIGERIGCNLRELNYPKEHRDDLRDYVEYLPKEVRKKYKI